MLIGSRMPRLATELSSGDEGSVSSEVYLYHELSVTQSAPFASCSHSFAIVDTLPCVSILPNTCLLVREGRSPCTLESQLMPTPRSKEKK